MTTTLAEQIPTSWIEVCRLDQLAFERGVAAIVNGEQVALFKVDVGGGDVVVFAVDHHDPISQANVMARGIVGRVCGGGDDGTWYVASPLKKERYDLETGACLSVDGARIRTWSTAIVDGVVMVGDDGHAA